MTGPQPATNPGPSRRNTRIDMEYRVKWEIDVTADSPEEAARLARAMQTSPDTTATVFDVTPVLERPAKTPTTVRIDLAELSKAPAPVLCRHCHKPIVKDGEDWVHEDGASGCLITWRSTEELAEPDAQPAPIPAEPPPAPPAASENDFAAALVAFEAEQAKRPVHPMGDGEPVWLDIPTPGCATDDPNASWVPIKTFSDMPQAIAYAQEHFGADDQGRVSLLSGGPYIAPVCPKCGGTSITANAGEDNRPGFPYCQTCKQLFGIGADYTGFRETERRMIEGRELVLMRRESEQIIVNAKTGLVEMDEAENGFESWLSEEANIRQIERETPVLTPVCPKCGGTSITIHVDAEATYELKGWDQAGEIVADFAEPADVATYDDRRYECDGCCYASSDAADFAPDAEKK